MNLEDLVEQLELEKSTVNRVAILRSALRSVPQEERNRFWIGLGEQTSGRRGTLRKLLVLQPGFRKANSIASATN